MGQAADDVLHGLCCQLCGEWMDDIIDGAEEPGYPRTCEGCGKEPESQVVPNRHKPPTHPPRNAHQQEARRLKNQAKRRRQKKIRIEGTTPSPKGTAP